MPDTDKKPPPWWRELLRKEAVGAHVVNAVVGLAVGFAAALLGTLGWVAWAAWRGSYLWTQRGIGAAMAFAVVLMGMAVALDILRRRLTVPGAGPVAPKGFLDHLVESDKALEELTRLMNKLTKITIKSTKRSKASTARSLRINKLPPIKRGRRKLAESRRSARSRDRTTKRIAAQIPQIERAVSTLAIGKLAFLKWYTANHQMSATDAQAQIQAARSRLSASEGWLKANAELRATIEAGRGASQVMDEAIDRDLAVRDRLYYVMESERAPLLELISLLEPYAKTPAEIVSPPSSAP